LIWGDNDIPKPTLEELEAAWPIVQKEKEIELIRTKRRLEYPPIADYLDGVVKGDQAQIDKYIAD